MHDVRDDYTRDNNQKDIKQDQSAQFSKEQFGSGIQGLPSLVKNKFN